MKETNRKNSHRGGNYFMFTTLQHFISGNRTMYAFTWKVLD